MGKTTGFLEYPRRGPSHRPVSVRLRDWREVYEPQSDEDVSTQGARCMDCGIPFCMQGCPLGNRIPTFNDHVYRSHWEQAADATVRHQQLSRVHRPALSRAVRVGLRARHLGQLPSPSNASSTKWPNTPSPTASTSRSSPTSAPAGASPSSARDRPDSAAAAQLASVGHEVHVFERSDAIGGLLRYGIPEFKLEKAVLERRLAVMVDLGRHLSHRTPASATTRRRSLNLQRDFDAVLLALGSTRPRLIPVPGSGPASASTPR